MGASTHFFLATATCSPIIYEMRHNGKIKISFFKFYSIIMIRLLRKVHQELFLATKY